METQTILIKNTSIIDREVRKGSVLIENDKIVEITSGNTPDNADEVINGEGKCLIPGLVNTHTHLSMSLMRGLADDLPLDTWLNDHIWPMEANLEEEHCYVGALLSALEMIKSGTTTCNDMYFYMDEVARALDESGMRGVISHGMIDLFDDEKRKAEFKETTRIIEKCHNTADGRIQVSLGPHTPYTCSPELLNWVRKKADEKGLRIHIHVSETEREVDDSLNERMKRPFEYLEDLKFLGPDVLAAHSVWLSGAEIALIKANKVKLSHNPLSNMKLASGISPVSDLMANGVCVSLGTDGAASNNNLDLFQEMKMSSLLQKVRKLDPTVMPASKVLEMATINGATALGMENEIGSIEVGKKADLVLVDMKAPHLTPYRNPISHLVYSTEGADVSTVICNGNILMKEKELLVLDEAEVMARAENAAQDLLSKS
ncbi:MAG: 5-methylthioadenosine/S-adenosylhomocysteine deaminase [Methanobacterium sp.]|jgi:5-methylthioadenosine/S-adenosylhomocysteine deaminase|uniref:amidohydrolase family protein n=1 Tax=Methanobacterium sp. TaxID=2164 RepID=UPI0003C9566A|nr:amidohydrolase family protein [Methanobacterium sp.]MDI3548981.1 5-methylthioadenosine/S-adenosylhomocysteine deaminase [Methanobacterium sp.]CDG64182.1 5-methylthioadenosine/S-adenosylhomocysteinedeaminase [Methanobacterium sp. MB1]